MEMTKHRSSTRLINQKKKLRQQASDQNDTASRLSFVVDLEASTVSDYLSTADISALLQACSSEFSQDFVNSLSQRAPDRFARRTKRTLADIVLATGCGALMVSTIVRNVVVKSLST